MIALEDLRPDDREAAHRLGRQAFGGSDAFDPGRPVMAPGRHLAAYAEGTLVGQMRRHPFGQFLGGRRLACAGISGVVVAPQARGRGLARRLLTDTMERAAADGEVVAALYPTSAALYRSAGFEVAGWWVERSVPVAELPADDGSLRWEPVAFDDPRLPALHTAMATDRDGWIDLDAGSWRWRAMQADADRSANRWCYVGWRGDEPVAALQYAYGRSERAMFGIDAELVVGVDGDAVRGALGFLGAHGTTAGEVRTTLPADELALHLRHVQRSTVHADWPWMLAFVDLPGAVAARGYPAAVAGTVALDVDDPHRPANAGRWVLHLPGNGTAELERGGNGRVEVAAPDLAAVFTGHLDPLRLARAGRLGHPTPADVGVLRAAFAGSPTLPTFF